MIGKRLVTKQTTSEGVRVDKVMIAEGVDIKRETYLAVLMDRESNGPVVVASPDGGMDIEAVAEKTPERIFKVCLTNYLYFSNNRIFQTPIDIQMGMTEGQSLKIAKDLQFEGKLIGVAAQEIKRLYDLFIAVDATQVEINPLVETADGRVFCVDAKMNFDDSAAYRQKEIFAYETFEEHVRKFKCTFFHY